MEATEQDEVENISPATTEEDTEDSESEAPPVVRRKVSFADAFGLDLVSVKEFENIEASQSEAQRQVAPAVEEFYMSCVFTVPSSPEELYQKLEAQMVELESLELLPGTTTLRGIIRVVNLCYSKSVFARVTLDDWSSYFDLPADYVPGSSDRKTDRFTFSYTLAPPFQRGGTRVEFCLRYETSAGTFWANNNGMNYVIFFHQRGAVRDGQENSGGDPNKKSCLKANRKRATEGRSWSSAFEGTTEDSTLHLKDQRTLVELRKRRQRAARLAHVKDMLSEKKGEKKCDLRALRSQSKVDKSSEILTYHQIPLLTLDWGDEAKHWDASKSAAIIAEQSKVAMNDTQSEHDQKGRNGSEETPVCDVWRAFVNRPSDGDELITRESEWLQLATSVTPLKKSVISQQLKTDDVAFEGENSSTNSKDFLLVEPNTGSLSGEISEQGNTHEGSFENMKLGNQAQDISEANILVSSENGVTPASTQVDLSLNDKAIHETCPNNLFLLEKKGIVTYQDEAIAVPRQTDKFKIGSTDENQHAEFRPISSESEENSQTSTHKESARRESDSKGRYPAVDKHLDIKQVALQREYFKTKTATDAGADAIQRIDERQGDSWLKCEVDDSNKRSADFNWSGVCQEKHGSHKSQSEMLEKLREVMREDMRGSTTMSTDMISKTLEGADTNTRSKDDTFGKMKVVLEEIGSVVRGPCETEMKEIFTEAISDKMLVDRFVENVIKGVWDEVFSEKALEKEQVLKCEAFKSPPAEKRLFKSPEVLEKRWSLSEEEMKSQNEGVSRNTSTDHQPETLDTSRVVIQTVAGEAEGVRPLSERKDTPVHTIVEDIGSSEKQSIKRGPDSTDAAPQESFIEHFVEILIRGIWEEVFSQMATNLKMTDRKDTILHHRQELRPLRCNDSTVVQETNRNLLAPVVNQSRGKNDKDSETQQHMTDDPNCKQTELQYLLVEDLVVLTGSVLSCQMISSSNCDEFSMTDQRVTSTGVEPDTFPQKLQSHLSLRAHLSQDFNTSFASRSRTTRNVVGRGSMVTDTTHGVHDQSSFQQIPHSERDESLTTNEARGDPKLSEFKPIDSLSDSFLGFNPATKTSSSYEDHTLFKGRPITFQTDLDSTESPPHRCPPSKRSKECDGLVWWSVLYILSHVTKLLTTGLFVAAFFVFVLIYDFPVFFALYVFSTCWCLYKWRAGTNSADKSSGS